MPTDCEHSLDAPIIERQSLCLSGSEAGVAIHAGEAGFRSTLEKHFIKAENNTAERLVDFKAELKKLDTEQFWGRLMEGVADICQAQFAFVSKRILVDDHNSAVEMPPIGEAGSCLMGVALYWNDGCSNKNLARDYKYYAWGAPCSYMRHDKVFLVPGGLTDFITENPNQLPFECDAYLGVPLFADGKCFAHFGLMWTKEGLEKKKDLSWGYLEMLLHTLEDMITERLVSGQGYAKVNAKRTSDEFAVPAPPAPRVIPQHSINAAQSLRPYARSLSHELRTPMQGVVGMLDVMHATVQDQLEGVASAKIRSIFHTLRDNIETVQDSSRRAIEAADNVVHAYDFNMQVPETPSQDLESPANVTSYFDSRPKMVEGSNIVNPFKRRRSSPTPWSLGSPPKMQHIEAVPRDGMGTPQSPLTKFDNDIPPPPKKQALTSPDEDMDSYTSSKPGVLTPGETEMTSSPGAKQSSLRDLLPIVINEALRNGGRPDSAITEPITFGERTNVRSRSSNGYASEKVIEWSVSPNVPEFIAVDERDVSKLISAVFLNAIKFTESGKITLHARTARNDRYVFISVVDTGSGIPEDFRPELFKPFSQEDNSLTRNKEGLGLGLLVAKSLARRMGGDIVLVRSEIQGPAQGSEFEIRLPLDQSDARSRATTPLFDSPDPSTRPTPVPNALSRPSATNGKAPPSPYIPQSPSLRTPRSTPTITNLAPLSEPSASDNIGPRANFVRRVSRTTKFAPTKDTVDKELAQKYPLRFLVAEDNKINRKLLVSMLSKFGYKEIYEAFDGREAVRITEKLLKDTAINGRSRDSRGISAPVIDVVLMDLWMPEMDGYEATEKILKMYNTGVYGVAPIILAVSADVTDAAVDRATSIGMQGYMTKPYKLLDLQKLILEFCRKD